MIAYKGFKPGLICMGYQFVMGLNVTGEANCACNGFHCAANPLDCLTYYGDMANSEYYLVNAGGDIDEDNVDSKISCTELTILKKLNLRDFVMHALVYMVDHPKMPWNPHVSKDTGESHGGFVIVRGTNPKARGRNGDILALAMENESGDSVIDITLAVVDGKKVCADVWYDINLTECHMA